MALCYGTWALATFWLPQFGPLALALAMILATLAIALHSSLQHEVLHGHPFASRALNEALVSLPLGLAIPYERFRDQHLAHHRDEHLTDPYDDPESNFLDPGVWEGLSRPVRALLDANNTLLGRMVLGPAIGMAVFLHGDWRAVRSGDRAARGAVLRAWTLHALGLAVMAILLAEAAMPLWAYLACAYAALSILKIRTFLEHRAHDRARGRSVVIEDRGLLAFLFLNNNLHIVHHSKPRLAWYRLPGVYAANRDAFLRRNEGYRYGSYGEVFRAHFLKAKDPVAHPLRRRRPG